MPKSALPPHLQNRLHEDYAWPFSLIPRAWTSYKFYGPPVLLWGNQENFVPTLPIRGPYFHIFDQPSKERYFEQPSMFPTLAPGPVPDPIQTGTNLVWGVYGVKLTKWMPVLPLGFALTWKLGKKRLHVRLGARWDDVDHYYTFPSLNWQYQEKYND